MRFRKECWFESGQGHHSRFARTLPLALVGLGLRPICGTNAIGRRALLSRDEGQRRDVIGFRNLLAAERAGALDIVRGDRKSVVEGTSVSVRVDLGGSRIIKKKTTKKKNYLR